MCYAGIDGSSCSGVTTTGVPAAKPSTVRHRHCIRAPNTRTAGVDSKSIMSGRWRIDYARKGGSETSRASAAYRHPSSTIPMTRPSLAEHPDNPTLHNCIKHLISTYMFRMSISFCSNQNQGDNKRGVCLRKTGKRGGAVKKRNDPSVHAKGETETDQRHKQRHANKIRDKIQDNGMQDQQRQKKREESPIKKGKDKGRYIPYTVIE